ncbi:hypothetical protein ACNESZ_001070 [Escherichia coli]
MSYDDELIKMLKSVIEIVDKIPEAPPSSDDKYDQIRDLANDVREKVLHKYPRKSSWNFSKGPTCRVTPAFFFCK